MGGLVALVPAAAILLLTLRTGANSSIVFTGNTRMPMVAGWDHLLPPWFTRLHRRYRTPVNSILFVAGSSVAFSLAGLLGVGEQEAFQLLDNAAGICYGLTYLVMFAIPLVARHAGIGRPRIALPLAALAGFGMMLLCVVPSILPIIGVASVMHFASTIGIVVVGLNVAGAALHRGARRRRAVFAEQRA